MSELAAAHFSCSACGKSYTWKKELAGKRAKCKCGSVMTVPLSPPAAESDDLYDLAPSGDEDSVKAAFAAARKAAAAAPEPARPATARAPASPIVGYQRGPTQREQERVSDKTLIDSNRDIYVPVALLVVGMALYVGYYAWRYSMGGTGIAFASLGVGMMTAFKAALLVGFAFAVAGPLGVSFGGIWTAILKLAAIAIFTDGVTTWVDTGVAKVSGGGFGGGGFLGWGIISFPVALGIYWVLLTYLFSMDSGDSWLVVMILAVFDYIVRTVLLLLMLKLILSSGGVSGAIVPTLGGGGGSGSTLGDPMVARVEELKEADLLKEARDYIAGGRQAALSKPVEAWYAAGCKKVWFEVSRDINGRLSPEAVIVELPRDKVKDKEARARCFQILKEYMDEHDFGYDPEDVTDDGGAYMTVPLGG